MDSYQFLGQAWQLSIMVNIDSTFLSPKILSIVKWMHICELLLIPFGFLTIIFTHIVIVKNSKLKLMHNNLKVFFHHAIAMSYMQQTIRFLLFCCAITGKIDDASIFGPLRIFHILHESNLMIAAASFTEASIDRFFATINPERYERQKVPYISCILILIIYFFVALTEATRYTGTLPMIYMPIGINIGSIITIPVRENIKICQAMIPGAILFTIGIFMFSALHVMVFVSADMQAYNVSLLLTTTFHFGSQILFIWAAMSFTFLIPEMREQALYLLFKIPMKTHVQIITPVHEQREIYFIQLRSMWETKTERDRGSQSPDPLGS